MNAKEFINKDISYGQKVKLTIRKGREFICFFAGWKTFGNIEPNLDYLMPVFYVPTQSGKMGRRSIFGPGRCTWVGLSDIEDIEKVTVQYRHIGYYNNVKDCLKLFSASPEEIVKHWKDNCGEFNTVEDGNVIDTEHFPNLVPTNDGLYAVSKDCSGLCGDDLDLAEKDCDCPYFIDIYGRAGEE